MRTLPRWPLFLIAAPAAVAVWSGWVGLGTLCGFGMVHPLPGIADGFQINTAITLPVGVEAYGAYALGAWLTPGVPGRARTFARRSAVGALALGMAGQVIYHLLAASAGCSPDPFRCTAGTADTASGTAGTSRSRCVNAAPKPSVTTGMQETRTTTGHGAR